MFCNLFRFKAILLLFLQLLQISTSWSLQRWNERGGLVYAPLFFSSSSGVGGIIIINVIEGSCTPGRILSCCTNIITTYMSVFSTWYTNNSKRHPL